MTRSRKPRWTRSRRSPASKPPTASPSHPPNPGPSALSHPRSSLPSSCGRASGKVAARIARSRRSVMAVRLRPFVFLGLVLSLVLGPAIGLAQTGGPDPDSPIQVPTEADNRTPTVRLDPTATVASSPDDQEATPGASPIAVAGPDLAAMTLDSRSMPDEYQLIGESYTPIEDLLDAMLGLIDRDELLATGIIAVYQSSYINVEDGSTIR